MLYELVNFSDQIGPLNVFKYIYVPDWRCHFYRALVRDAVRSGNYRFVADQARQGTADPR